MTAAELAALWSRDVLELGMIADQQRHVAFPDNIVTYCLQADDSPLRITLSAAMPEYGELQNATNAPSILPVCAPGLTAAEYLRFVALCRIALPAAHVLLDARRSGLKVAQTALRFGADDFGSLTEPEEEIRRIIRDAGYKPKRRDAGFRWLALG